MLYNAYRSTGGFRSFVADNTLHTVKRTRNRSPTKNLVCGQ